MSHETKITEWRPDVSNCWRCGIEYTPRADAEFTRCANCQGKERGPYRAAPVPTPE